MISNDLIIIGLLMNTFHIVSWRKRYGHGSVCFVFFPKLYTNFSINISLYTFRPGLCTRESTERGEIKPTPPCGRPVFAVHSTRAQTSRRFLNATSWTSLNHIKSTLSITAMRQPGEQVKSFHIFLSIVSEVLSKGSLLIYKTAPKSKNKQINELNSVFKYMTRGFKISHLFVIPPLQKSNLWVLIALILVLTLWSP